MQAPIPPSVEHESPLPVEAAATADMQTSPVTLGEWLQQGREQANLSASELATRLRMGVKQIQALEKNDYVELPSGTFLRGFVRNYAKALGLDPDRAIQLLEADHPGTRVEHASVIVAPEPATRVVIEEGRSPIGAKHASIAGVVLLVLVGAIWYWAEFIRPGLQPDSHEAVVSDAVARPPQTVKPLEIAAEASAPEAKALTEPVASIDATNVQVANSPAEIGSTVAKPIAPEKVVAPIEKAVEKPLERSTAAPIQGAKVGLTFQAESWVEITDATGRIRISRRYQGGDADELLADAPLSVVIGNAPATRLVYNGKEIDLAPYTKLAVARIRLE